MGRWRRGREHKAWSSDEQLGDILKTDIRTDSHYVSIASDSIRERVRFHVAEVVQADVSSAGHPSPRQRPLLTLLGYLWQLHGMNADLIYVTVISLPDHAGRDLSHRAHQWSVGEGEGTIVVMRNNSDSVGAYVTDQKSPWGIWKRLYCRLLGVYP